MTLTGREWQEVNEFSELWYVVLAARKLGYAPEMLFEVVKQCYAEADRLFVHDDVDQNHGPEFFPK